MGTIKELLAKARAARESNFTFRQLPAIWRGRATYLQILKNFRELEGSWYKGFAKFMDIFSGGA